jgi:transmembrane sensor
MSADDPEEHMIQEEAADWVAILTSGEARHADLEAFEFWRQQSSAHESAWRRAASSMQQLQNRLARPRSLRNDRLTRHTTRQFITRRQAIGFTALAACAGAGVLIARPPLQLWPSLRELQAGHRTAAGEQKQLRFGASIRIDMNTRTSINIDATLGITQIELVSGEAVITSGAEQAWQILAPHLTVQGLIDEVNVFSAGGKTRLSCMSGTVECSRAGKSQRVDAGQTLIADASEPYIMAPFASLAGPQATWRQGYLSYQREALRDVIADLNRYWKGRLILRDRALGERRVTARFELSKIDRVAQDISEVFGVPIREFPGGLVFIG